MAFQALLLAAAPLWAAPTSCPWLGYDKPALVATLTDVFNSVKAHYALSPEVKLYYLDDDAAIVDTLKLPANLIAVAFPDHWPRNKADTQAILVTRHAFEVACNPKQLGLVVSHEFVHLREKHVQTIADHAKRKYLAWAELNADAYAPLVPPLKDFLAKYKDDLDTFQRPKEKQADDAGTEELRKLFEKNGAKLEDKEVVALYGKLGDYDRATGVDAAGGDHGTAQERADNVLKMCAVLP